MTRKLVALALALGVLASAAAIDQPARAQGGGAAASIAPAMDAKRRINLAGRQRMLTQFMAKATCFVSMGIDEKTQVNEIWASHDLFAQTLSDLRKGNPDVSLLPEQDATILGGLDGVRGHWDLYGRAVMQGDLEIIIAQNGVVLDAMNEVVSLIERKYGGAGKIAPEIAAAINVAGRQRMLSQKASKEVCLIATGQDAAENRKRLAATIELFERSLRALREGDAALGLRPAPTSEIAAQIDSGRQEWLKLKTYLDRAATGGKPTPEDVAAVARLNTPVLDAMDDLVELYEAAGG